MADRRRLWLPNGKNAMRGQGSNGNWRAEGSDSKQIFSPSGRRRRDSVPFWKESPLGGQFHFLNFVQCVWISDCRPESSVLFSESHSFNLRPILWRGQNHPCSRILPPLNFALCCTALRTRIDCISMMTLLVILSGEGSIQWLLDLLCRSNLPDLKDQIGNDFHALKKHWFLVSIYWYILVVYPLKNLSEFWVTWRCPFSLSLYKLGFISQQWWTRSSGRRKLWHLMVNEWDRSKWPELYGQEMEASWIVTVDRCPRCDQRELEGEDALGELIVAMFLSSFSSRRQ
jgi:hypothetical protein